MLTVVTLWCMITVEVHQMKDHYHHGNLKQELLETSIRIISEQGFDQLSLRKVAAQCGVSHNAVYRHFEQKAQLIDCCRAHVTQTLMHDLEQVLEGLPLGERETLYRFCVAYVGFYQEHPTYFSARYRNAAQKVVLSITDAAENYPPFERFRQIYQAYAEHQGLSEEMRSRKLVHLWAFLHGVISLATSPQVVWDGAWEACLNDIL